MKRAKAISVTVPYELADRMAAIGRRDNKSVSSIVSEAVAAYCLKQDFEEAREVFSEKARKKGVVSEEDIGRVVDEYRKERKKS